MPLLSIIATSSIFCVNHTPWMGACTQYGAVDGSKVPLSKIVGLAGAPVVANCARERWRTLQDATFKCWVILGTFLYGCATGLSYCNHTIHAGELPRITSGPLLGVFS